MKGWFRWLILPWLMLLSYIPLRILYGMGSVLRFFLYHIFRYRREIVRENLERSFPFKSKSEIDRIESCFYHYFADLFVEILKLITISEAEMKKRFVLSEKSKEVMIRLLSEKKNLIVVLGHLGNWEWGGPGFYVNTGYPLYVIYKPLSNKNFDALFYRTRTRLGTKAIAMEDTYRSILSRKEDASITAFASDQTPSNNKTYFTSFLNQDTAVFRGTARIALKTGYPVIYAYNERVSRGKYVSHIEMLIEDPSVLTEDEITEIHTRRLEKDILENPCTWLWSHRRWKHKRPVPINS